MSPALNGSSALQRFERSNVIEIRNGIMLDFYPELPHIQKVPCKVTQWWRLYLQKLVKTVVFVCGRLPYKEVIDAPTHQHNTKTRSSPFSKIPKEKMATSTAPWGILCPRQYWYDFHLVLSCRIELSWLHDSSRGIQQKQGWIATNYLIDNLESMLSCLAHIHKGAFHVASWKSAQPPPPLATGDERIDMAWKVLSDLERKVASIDARLLEIEENL